MVMGFVPYGAVWLSSARLRHLSSGVPGRSYPHSTPHGDYNWGDYNWASERNEVRPACTHMQQCVQLTYCSFHDQQGSYQLHCLVKLRPVCLKSSNVVSVTQQQHCTRNERSLHTGVGVLCSSV